MERMEKRLAEVERLLGAAEARTVSDDRRDTDVEAMRAMIAGEISALGDRAEPADDAHRKTFERLQSELSEAAASRGASTTSGVCWPSSCVSWSRRRRSRTERARRARSESGW